MIGESSIAAHLRPLKSVSARAVLAVALLLGSRGALAMPDAGVGAVRSPLPPLPELPSVELPMPNPEVTQRLNDLLERLKSADAGQREMAASEILEIRPIVLPAIEAKLRRLADRADKDAMKSLLEKVRKKGRDEARERSRAEGEKGAISTPDYLQLIVNYAKPEDENWQNLAETIALSRMLKHIGTINAARQLIEIYVRFGEFLRVDTQLQLEALGDRGVAALIEARRHKATKISRWAERQLDVLGKAIPSQTVQTKDYDGLADILRAYGRTRDPDAARIMISFCNSERSQIREAARQAVVMMGDVTIWQLRDAFENVTGERPPRDWSWERAARELFGRFDRQRHARVYTLFENGLQVLAQGDVAKAKTLFDSVLARSPTFDRATEMAPGYLKFARETHSMHLGHALDAARRAERIATDQALKKQAASLRTTLEALELLDRGLVDQSLLQQALALDADNSLAKETLDRVRHGPAQEQIDQRRWGVAAIIAAVALIAMLWVGFRRPRSSSPLTTPASPEAAHEPMQQHENSAPPSDDSTA